MEKLISLEKNMVLLPIVSVENPLFTPDNKCTNYVMIKLLKYFEQEKLRKGSMGRENTKI